jgi:cytoskeletal protein CcmA (bactofilin family)
MKKRNIYRGMAIISILVLFSLVLATPARAFEGRGGDQVIIPAGEVVTDDLYVGAQTFTLDGTIQGDLLVAGNQITINGRVEGDLFAVGQTVIINGQVQDSARIAGAALILGNEASIGHDLLGTGYSLETRPGSSIGGDALFGGGQMLHAGSIARNLYVGSQGLALQGNVGGDVKAEVGSANQPSYTYPFGYMPNMPVIPTVASGLTVGSQATIGGNLDYRSWTAGAVSPGSVSGQVDFTPIPQPNTNNPSNWFANLLRSLATLILVGLLMVWLAPGFTRQGATTIRSKPWPSLGWGVVSIFAFFFVLLALIAAVILLSILFGVVTLGDLLGTTIWVGLLAVFALVMVFSLAAGYVSKILISCLGGRLILEQVKPEWAESRVWPVVVGIAIFVVLAAIPFFGGLISLIGVLFGLGALWLLAQDRLISLRRKPASPPAVAD